MKLVLISDTHGYHRYIDLPKDCDLLIHCGDLTMSGEMDVVIDYADWVNENGYKGKNLFVPGNHDFCFDQTNGGLRYNAEARAHLEGEAGTIYMVDRLVTIDGLNFYGAPWCPNLERWAFYDGGKDCYASAPTEIDVLVTHSPAFGVLDFCGPHVGSKFLSSYIRRSSALLHAHGHIHECYGVAGPFGENPLSYTAVNAAICDRQYRANNNPIVAEVDVANETVDLHLHEGSLLPPNL